MAATDTRNLAVFCDFENVALGAEDLKAERFDIRLVLEKLLVKGSIVVKKAYCDWERYKAFKKPMHEAAFELIEIPHVRQSGKNSADIRMVVDALDLCYTKSHVDTFVLVTGDSDFSPLVSKLRENNKTVIGVGVRASTSDLLIRNCDEFVFYDDLAHAEHQRARPRAAKPEDKKKDRPRKKTEAAAAPPSAADDRRSPALDAVIATVEALAAERGDDAPVWGSIVKQTLKRRQPGFNESAYGYRGFNDLLADAQARGLLKLEHDERSGGYRVSLPA